MSRSPVLLSAEQIRQFIADGYLVLQPSLPANLHRAICHRLTAAIPESDNPGNNILPLVPEMRHVLEAPEVHGALLSLLGPGYLEHPHRFCHIEAQQSADGIDYPAKLAGNCHQDSYTPLGRPRHHHIRYLRLMYYPQDTPQELGPTHVIPGTHLNGGLNDSERARPLPVRGGAGTVSLTHFDLGHAAGVNFSAQRRFMVKFIFMRATAPQANGWSDPDQAWANPGQISGPDRMELAWSHLWDWMRGAERYASLAAGALADEPVAAASGMSVAALRAQLNAATDSAARVAAAHLLAARGAEAVSAVPDLIAVLNRVPDPVRVAATYALGAIGAPAVESLAAVLRGSGDALPQLLRGVNRSKQARWREPGQWREQALVMDDAGHALGAMGTTALPVLVDLLRDASEWARVNAAFALGEMDAAARDAVPALAAALDDPSHFVVRTAADALGAIGSAEAAAPLGVLLHHERPGWDQLQIRGWCLRDQVRVNAATALARLGTGAAAAEADLIAALDDPCGQVTSFVVTALRRLGSPSAAGRRPQHAQCPALGSNAHRRPPLLTAAGTTVAPAVALAARGDSGRRTDSGEAPG